MAKRTDLRLAVAAMVKSVNFEMRKMKLKKIELTSCSACATRNALVRTLKRKERLNLLFGNLGVPLGPRSVH